MQKLIDNTTTKLQVQKSIASSPFLHAKYKKLLTTLNSYGNPDWSCAQETRNIFPSVKKLARNLKISERTVQRHLGYLVSQGYLYIREEFVPDGDRMRQTTSRYYFTQRLLDPFNETLKAEILAENKPRASQVMGKGVKLKDLDKSKCAMPRLLATRRRIVTKSKNVTHRPDPVPKNYVSNSLSTHARVDVGIKAPSGASTPENSVFPSGGRDPLKAFEAHRTFCEISDMLNSRKRQDKKPLGSSWQWWAFQRGWHENDMTYEEAMRRCKTIMADPSLVYTTTSASRIFHLKEILKIRKTIQKKQDSVYRTQENFGVWNGRDFERDSVVLRWFNYEDGLAAQLLEHGLAERRAARRQAMKDSRHVAEEFHDPRLELITF